MQINEEWLREWLATDSDIGVIAEGLTSSGLEVDSLTPVAPDFEGVVVAEVKRCEPHPDADRLKVCMVDTGEAQSQVVCGASNVRAGLKVAFVKAGGVLPDNFNIKKTRLRGVESCGMICSARELGLGDEHEGILELDADAPVGKNFRDYFRLDDHIIDIDLTPNRGDCSSLRGISRDLAARLMVDNTPPEIPEIKSDLQEKFKVTVAAPQACPRYVCRIIKSINREAKTPWWMKERLRRAGLRAIHPVVDVGNYVMLELGQPLHAFDLKKLHGDITVRFAKAGEKITLLDGKTITLSPENLLIADDQQPQALAGIMGGQASAVDHETEAVLLESAYFAAETITRSVRESGLNSDSSYRFERGVDFELQVLAMQRFTQLLREVCGGEVAELVEVCDQAHLPVIEPILFRTNEMVRMLGVHFNKIEIVGILSSLGCRLKARVNDWEVVPPSYRYDLRIEADLFEELIRINGYDEVPTVTARLQKIVFSGKTTTSSPYHWLFHLLVDLGYHEAINYSFVSPEIQSYFAAPDTCLTLANPLNREMSVMRTSLWPGLLQSLQYNLNYQASRVRLFETGLCFIQQQGELLQLNKLAGLIAGKRHELQWGQGDESVDFFDIKGDVEQILYAIGQDQACEWKKLESDVLHPGQAAELWLDGQLIGSVGALHPEIVTGLDLAVTPYLFELDLSILKAKLPASYKNIVKFPALWRDIAIVTDEAVSAQAIETCIRQSAGDLLQEARVFDIYQGQGVESGKKSVALSLCFQNPDATMTDDQVNQLLEVIIADLARSLGASMRKSA